MIVVTAATGFIGGYLVRELRGKNEALCLTSRNRAKLDGGGFCRLDLDEPESFSALPDGIDSFVHLAAAIPQRGEVIPFERYMAVNAIALRQLLEAVSRKGCRKFVYASTQMVVERPFYLPVDEGHPLVAASDYGLSKAVGERYCLSYAESSGMKVVALRFARIYGAGENPGFMLTDFIGRAMRGMPLPVHGTGGARRDMLYVKDAVRAILCALDSDASGVFNIGSGVGVSIREISEAISEVFSGGASAVEFRAATGDEGRDFFFDIGKAGRELGFVPRYSLKAGLTDYRLEMEK